MLFTDKNCQNNQPKLATPNLILYFSFHFKLVFRVLSRNLFFGSLNRKMKIDNDKIFPTDKLQLYHTYMQKYVLQQ